MGMEKEGVRGFWWEAARPGPDICLEVGTVSHWTQESVRVAHRRILLNIRVRHM